MFPREEENWEPAGPKISTLLGKARIQRMWLTIEEVKCVKQEVVNK